MKVEFWEKTMYKLILAIFLTLTNAITAQVSGISGSKLCVPDAASLEVGVTEFEPSFSTFTSSQNFCSNGNVEDLKYKSISSEFMLRVTAGILDNVEIGTAFSTTLERIFFGSKYIFLYKDNYSTGLTAGFSLPAGNGIQSDSTKLNSNINLSIGFLHTQKFSDSFSLDAQLVGTNEFGNSSNPKIINYGIGIGNWFTERFQGVIEILGYNCFEKNSNSSKISVASGFTFKVSPVLLFVFGGQFDLKGSNTEKSMGYFAAFTFAFN